MTKMLVRGNFAEIFAPSIYPTTKIVRRSTECRGCGAAEFKDNVCTFCKRERE